MFSNIFYALQTSVRSAFKIPEDNMWGKKVVDSTHFEFSVVLLNYPSVKLLFLLGKQILQYEKWSQNLHDQPSNNLTRSVWIIKHKLHRLFALLSCCTLFSVFPLLVNVWLFWHLVTLSTRNGSVLTRRCASSKPMTWPKGGRDWPTVGTAVERTIYQK